MIRLMSDCLLRISEAVAVDIEDIDTTLTIRSSKTDQEGKGESLFIGEPTLEAIDTYCKAGEIESGALFRRIRRGGHITPERLTVISARRIIKKWAKAAGIEGFISGHLAACRHGGLPGTIRSDARRYANRRSLGRSKKCPPTTRKLNWRNGARSQGSFMESETEQNQEEALASNHPTNYPNMER